MERVILKRKKERKMIERESKETQREKQQKKN